MNSMKGLKRDCFAKIIFIVGGSRSGKSDFAQSLAEDMNQPRYFLATCPADDGGDSEMAERIIMHQQKRSAMEWQTIEEQLNLEDAIREIPDGSAILIDCLTLWVSNLIFRHGEGRADDLLIREEVNKLLTACKNKKGNIIMVSGEVGCGIVPENLLARKYRDLVGRCNQLVAAASHEVFQVCCGIPNKIK